MKENKINNNLINSRKKSWIKPLYTLFVVALPAIFIWIFFGEFNIANFSLQLWAKFLIAIAFVTATTLLTTLLIYFKIFDIFILTFVLPVSISLMMIFVSEQLPIYARALLVIPFISLIIPINIICNKINERINFRKKAKKEKEEKFIGQKD